MITRDLRSGRRALCVVVALFLAGAAPARADIEEVTFQADLDGEVTNDPLPGGPAPVTMTGTFFFDTTQLTGGLRPVFQRPGSAPGEAGTAVVFFAADPGGNITVTYADGARLTMPFFSPFSLYGDFQAPLCGPFDDCAYRVGQVLTLDQFNAAVDPWALIFNGMNGGFVGFFPLPLVDALPPGSGEWSVQGAGAFQVRSVPEPDALALFVLGLAGLVLARQRMRAPGGLNGYSRRSRSR